MKNPKQLLIVAVAAIALYAGAVHFNLVPGARKQASATPQGFTLSNDAPDAPTPVATSTVAFAAPTTKPCLPTGPVVRANIWAWNAQMGLLLANGGPTTTCGSLMAKHGVALKIVRQDDTNQSQSEQVKFATALAGGNANPSDGIQFAIVMGDGGAQYLSAIDKSLDKLGPDYRAEMIGAVGYSRGEDGWWGPQEWKDDPANMKGGATSGVLRDGDWNIAEYKLANDGVKNNPDQTTWDPDAMNWFAADDYLKAVEMYNNGYCEDRPVVRNGKLTSEPKHHTCVQGVVTWTPGDVNMAHGKGGLVRLLSTKENVYQMPAVVIGIHKWDAAHGKQVEGLLQASFEAADQIKSNPEALNAAGKAAYAVYAEQSPGYWIKYYKGVVERDSQKNPVPLGGSTVMNLADNLVLFGLAEGTGGVGSSLFKATYEGFGTIAKQQYPKLVPSFPSAEQAVNLSFLQALKQSAAPADAENAQLEDFSGSGAIQSGDVVAKRNWSIQFATGSAAFTPQAQATLDMLYQQLIVGGALQVEIDGHTDNVGNPTSNQLLSEARAEAVAAYLKARAGKFFPEGRVTVKGFGDSQPVAPNATPSGQAQNRRVTVVLGTKV